MNKDIVYYLQLYSEADQTTGTIETKRAIGWTLAGDTDVGVDTLVYVFDVPLRMAGLIQPVGEQTEAYQAWEIHTPTGQYRKMERFYFTVQWLEARLAEATEAYQHPI